MVREAKINNNSNIVINIIYNPTNEEDVSIINITNVNNDSSINIDFDDKEIQLNLKDETYYHELNVDGIKEALISLINA